MVTATDLCFANKDLRCELRKAHFPQSRVSMLLKEDRCPRDAGFSVPLEVEVIWSALLLITRETLPAGLFSETPRHYGAGGMPQHRPGPRFDPRCFKIRRKNLCKSAVVPGKKEAQLDTQAG